MKTALLTMLLMSNTAFAQYNTNIMNNDDIDNGRVEIKVTRLPSNDEAEKKPELQTENTPSQLNAFGNGSSAPGHYSSAAGAAQAPKKPKPQTENWSAQSAEPVKVQAVQVQTGQQQAQAAGFGPGAPQEAQQQLAPAQVPQLAAVQQANQTANQTANRAPCERKDCYNRGAQLEGIRQQNLAMQQQVLAQRQLAAQQAAQQAAHQAAQGTVQNILQNIRVGIPGR